MIGSISHLKFLGSLGFLRYSGFQVSRFLMFSGLHVLDGPQTIGFFPDFFPTWILDILDFPSHNSLGFSMHPESLVFSGS